MYSNVMNPLLNKTAVCTAAIVFVLATILMQIQGKPLRTTNAPLGIVSLEISARPALADSIKYNWQQITDSGKALNKIALNNILLDFFYIATYGIFLILLALRLHYNQGKQKALPLAAKLAFIAGGLDVIENLLMLYTLQQQSLKWITQITAWAAYTKFICLLIAVIIITISASIALLSKRKISAVT